MRQAFVNEPAPYDKTLCGIASDAGVRTRRHDLTVRAKTSCKKSEAKYNLRNSGKQTHAVEKGKANDEEIAARVVPATFLMTNHPKG